VIAASSLLIISRFSEAVVSVGAIFMTNDFKLNNDNRIRLRGFVSARRSRSARIKIVISHWIGRREKSL